MERLRVYEPEECAVDGYPIAWRQPKGAAIKELIRELAGHRCVRCGHPFRTGESPAEWSPCDMECSHQGPIRLRPAGETEEWHFLDEWIPDEFYTETGLLVWADAEVEARYRVLTTHHLNGNKADCRWWNLVALCQRCHLTIQGRVKLERTWPWEHTPWFKPYVAGFYAFSYLGEDLDREETESRLDELLALERAIA